MLEAEPSESTPVPAARREPSAAPGAVLVVEGDRHSREGLRDALAHGGYAVEVAADGWEAIEKIRTRGVDAAIVDLDLPPLPGLSVSGWDLVRICRAYQPAIDIILVGAEWDALMRGRARRLRVTELLEKPISPAQVLGILRTFRQPSGH